MGCVFIFKSEKEGIIKNLHLDVQINRGIGGQLVSNVCIEGLIALRQVGQ